MSEKPADKNDKSAAERAAHTPQGDHTPRQEEQHARERQQAAAADTKSGGKSAARAAQPRDEAAEQHDAEARAAASIGAQIILDYNEPASIGARGGAGGTIEENTQARDAHLVAMGLDPADPTGPPPTPEQLKAKQEQAEKEVEPAFLPPAASGKATRASSLAAGISELPTPPPPAP